MASKITYENKECLIEDSTIPDKNKVLDADMNEIKQVVNNNADELETAEGNIDALQNRVSTNEIDISDIKAEQQTQDNNIQNNANNIENLSGRVGTNEDNIEDILTEMNGVFSTLTNQVGRRIELDLNSSTFVLTASLKNSLGNVLNSVSVDLPLETMVVNATYNDTTKKIILTLQNGNTVEFSIADLIDGLVSQTDFDELEERVETAEEDITDLKEEQINQNNDIEALQEENAELQQENKDLLNANYKIPTETPAENITLNKTSKNKFVKFGVAGNRKQTTYNGYQLIHQPSQDTTSEAVGITFKSNADGTYRISGTATGNRQELLSIDDGIFKAVTSINFSSLAAGDYSVSIIPISGTPKGIRVRNDSETIATITAENITTPAQFTLAEDSSSIQLYYYISNEEVVDFTFKIQLEKGTTAHEWEPYVGGQASPNPTYKQPIYAVGDNGTANTTIVNKNFLDFYNNAQQKTKTENGITFTVQSDGSILCNGTATATATMQADQLIEGNNKYIQAKILDGQLTGTSTSWYNYLFITFEENYLDAASKSYSNSSTVPTSLGNYKYKYHRLMIAKGITCNNLRIGLMISNKVTDYVAHQSQKYAMPCQKPMSIEDYFDWNREKEIHKRKFVILDGTETWSTATSITSGTTRFLTSDFTDIKKTGGGNTRFAFSNSFQPLTWGQMYSTDTETKNAISNYSNTSSPTSRLAIRIESTIASTVEEFKAYLSARYANNNPVVVEYILEQDEELDFTQAQKEVANQIKKATSYYEQTNIYSTDEVSPIYDATAVGDMNLIIDPIDARLTLIEE